MPRNPDAPRWQGKMWHLTYKTHVVKDDWLAKFRPQMEGFDTLSYVHENGDVDEDDPTPYEHTHIAIKLKKPLDTMQARYFDFRDIHPNFVKVSLKHLKHLCLTYHRGHKTKKDGKKYYIEPVMLYQEGVEEWKFAADAWKIAQEAPSLEAACNELGLEIKSIGDTKIARAEGLKRKFDEMDEDCFKDYCLPCPVEWNRKKKAMYLTGPPSVGKTQWALAQFQYPYLVSGIDDLKQIPDGCDGLVFDDQKQIAKYPKDLVINLLTVSQYRTIHTRYTSSRVPPLPRIFTANDHDYLFGNPEHPDPEKRLDPQTWEAYDRRILRVNSKDFPGGKLFKVPQEPDQGTSNQLPLSFQEPDQGTSNQLPLSFQEPDQGSDDDEDLSALEAFDQAP
jgi:hypothetical protein